MDNLCRPREEIKNIPLSIRWEEKKTNTDVLKKANLPSIFTILCKRRLKWLSHVTRVDDARIPKQMLYDQMATGKRARGSAKTACPGATLFCRPGNNWHGNQL